MLATNAILVLASFSAVDTPQLYEFTANWCSACRDVEPNVSRLVAQGVPIQRVDVDKRPEWAKKARVHALPCFIAVANGREVGRIEGAASVFQLSALYLQAVQHSTRAGDTRTAPSANDMANAEMVRGQTPSRLSPGKRLGQAVSGLKRRTQPEATSRAAPAAPAVNPPRLVGVSAVESDPASAAPPDRALAATVRIKVVDETGQSYGTGTIIDVHDDEALVVTCGHIFRDSDGKGRVLCDAFAPGATPGIEGRLISYDVRRDVGLVSFRPGVPVTAVSVGGTGYRARVGEAVFCIGCNHGSDPTVINNEIIAVNRYHGPPNLVVGGRPVDGRSGGGLFTADGVLIGICNAADSEYDEGLYAALGNVHAQLDAAGLGYIHRPKQSAVAQRDRSTEPMSTNSARSGSAAPRAVAGENAGVRQDELICIIRSPGDSQPRSVFVLDRPSKTLLDQLAAEKNRRGPHLDTQMHVDNQVSRAAEPGTYDARSRSVTR